MKERNKRKTVNIEEESRTISYVLHNNNQADKPYLEKY